MSDVFTCPRCGAAYAREKRRIGKAVVCSCGHKFLVPPPDAGTAGARDEPPSALRKNQYPQGSAPIRRGNRPAPASDSSGEVLPLPEPAKPPASHSTRWAAPVEPQEDEPLMEAEVVYSSDPYQGAVQPADAMDDLLGPLGPYADPIATGGYSAPLTPPPPPRHKKKKKQGSSPGTDAIARFVLFGMLPCAAVFVLLGFLGVFRGLVLFPLMAKDFARQAQRPTSNEPGPSGQAITIWDAKESAGGVFSVEYRVDGGTLEPAGSYFWIINGPVGKVEFPIPGATWAKQRQQLSGRAPAANGTDLNGRLTCYIEEQAGTTRRRISNEVTVRH